MRPTLHPQRIGVDGVRYGAFVKRSAGAELRRLTAYTYIMGSIFNMLL